MSKPLKFLTIFLWIGAVISVVGVLAMLRFTSIGRSDTHTDITPAAPQAMYDSPDFSLTDQNNQTLTNKQLLGHPWVCDFVFTTCNSICPRMTDHMAKLQKQIPAEVKLISFSVDPEHDTPAAMHNYLQDFQPEPGRWMMLTGDLKTQTRVVTSMKLHFVPAAEGQPIQHDSHFILVDAQGKIRGYYESDDKYAVDHLIRDVNYLIAHPDETAK